MSGNEIRDEVANSRRVSLLFLPSWVLLCLAQTGFVPGLRYQWSLNLWAYYDVWVGVLAALATLPFVFERVRVRTAAAVCRVADVAFSSVFRRALVSVMATLLFWLLRERGLGPDAKVWVASVFSGQSFIFPEMGATWLMYLAAIAGRDAGFETIEVVRALICVFGGVSVFLALELGTKLFGAGARSGLIAVLLLSSATFRIFCGRVEVYSFALAAALAYLVFVMRYLRTGRGWIACCFFLGIAGWVHAAMVLLVPSIVILPRVVETDLRGMDWAKKLALGALVASVPFAIFAIWIVSGAGGIGLGESWTRIAEIFGQNADPNARRWWVRGWGAEPSIGTDIVLFSRSQFKFLMNAAFLLCPSVIVCCIVSMLMKSSRTITENREWRVIRWLMFPTLIYGFALRPFWGPFDWDLFSVTALILVVAVSMYLVTAPFSGPVRRQIVVAIVAIQLFAFGVPFTFLGEEPKRDAGPFFPEGNYLNLDLAEPATEPPPQLKPWL